MILKEWMSGWGLLIISGTLDALAVLFIKMSFNQFGAIPLNSLNGFLEYFQIFLKSPMAILGILFYALSPFLWFLALSRLEVTQAYPILVSLHLVLTAIIAVALLGEQMTLYKLLAIVLILASVFLIYLDARV